MIRDNVTLGKNAVVDRFVVLGKLPRKAEKHLQLKIGDNCIIRSFTTIYGGTIIGDNLQTGHNVLIREDNIIKNGVSIGSGAFIEPGNKIGNNVRIHSGCFFENVTVEDNVSIGPNVVFTDDPHPACPRYKECVLGATVKRNVSIGANSTILPGIIIEENSLIGAGSVVTKDIPKNSVVTGNPAKIVKKIDDLKCIKGFYKKPYEWRR